MENTNIDLEQTLISQRYEYYQKQKVNNSASANEIIERIKEGYIPNEADVFELFCDDQAMIDEYREMYDVRQRVKEGTITESDYQFLIDKMQINDESIEQQLRQAFKEKGILISDSEESKHIGSM